MEEILPGFDVIPTATIAWFLSEFELIGVVLESRRPCPSTSPVPFFGCRMTHVDDFRLAPLCVQAASCLGPPEAHGKAK